MASRSCTALPSLTHSSGQHTLGVPLPPCLCPDNNPRGAGRNNGMLWTDQAALCRRSLDLGQFERFKRVFFTPHFQPMLGHAEATLLSEIPISDCKWRGRILILHGVDASEQAVYDITMGKVTLLPCQRQHPPLLAWS